MPSARVYFYSLASRKELRDHPYNGRAPSGVSGMVRNRDGEFVQGTATSIDLFWQNTTVTAEDFDEPVAAKLWFPRAKGKVEVEWRKLVREDDFADSSTTTILRGAHT